MGRPRRSSVRRYHDRVADRYDHAYDDEYWRWHDALTWDYIKPFLPVSQAAPVTDLGCGTGKWGARLVKSGYAVTSVDISPKMLDQARARIEPLDTGGRAAFVQADLVDLSALPRKHYCLALAMGDPIGCTTSPPEAMKQIRRILTDGGVLVATFDNRLAAIDFYLQKGDLAALRRFLRDGRTHWLTRDQDERFTIHTYRPDEVVALAESTGFEVLDLVGKTVLPMRQHRERLDAPDDRRALLAMEKSLCRNPFALGRASHLQIACRVRGG